MGLDGVELLCDRLRRDFLQDVPYISLVLRQLLQHRSELE